MEETQLAETTHSRNLALNRGRHMRLKCKDVLFKLERDLCQSKGENTERETDRLMEELNVTLIRDSKSEISRVFLVNK